MALTAAAARFWPWIGAALLLHAGLVALLLLLPPMRLPEPTEGAVLIWAVPLAETALPGNPMTVAGPPGPEAAEPWTVLPLSEAIEAPPVPPMAPPSQAMIVPPPPVVPPPSLPPEAPRPLALEPAPPPIAPLAARPPSLPTPQADVPQTSPPPAPPAPPVVTEKPAEAPPSPAPPRPAPARRAASTAPSTAAPAAQPGQGGLGAPAWAAEGATAPPGPLDGHRNEQPAYPPGALFLGQQGTVRLRLTIGTDGRVQSVALERGSGVTSLDAAAIDAARRWRFRPAIRRGEAVAADATTSVTFQIPGTPRRF